MEDDPLSGLPHGLSFRFVDRILEYEPGVKVLALKNVTSGEPHMEGCLPDAPAMPLACVLEAMTQTVGLLVSSGAPTFLAQVRDVQVRRPVLPGDRLTIEVNLLQGLGSLHRCDVTFGVPSPNLPLAPAAYDRRYQDQFSNALRLFFNSVTNKINSPLPHASYYDTTTQTNPVADAVNLMLFNSVISEYDIRRGIPTSKIYVADRASITFSSLHS